MAKRTLGRLVLSFGVALVYTYADDYFKERKEKKAKKEKDIENDLQKDIFIVIEV